MGFVIRQLLQAGLLHEDVNTVAGHGLHLYTREPWLNAGELHWREAPEHSAEDNILRPVTSAFSPDGGLRLLRRSWLAALLLAMGFLLLFSF